MNARIALVLGLVLALTPATVAAQADGSPDPESLDRDLVTQLCAATAVDETALDDCIGAVGAALAQLSEEPSDEDRSLLDQLSDAVDGALNDVQKIDVEGAIDDAIAEAQTAIDELELPTDVDIRTAIDEVVAEAVAATEEIDLQAAVDDALAEAQMAIDDADIEGSVDEAVAALEERVEDARIIVGEAQLWVQENRDAVCLGGSISLGTAVGITVFVATGLEWLALQAFRAAEGFTSTVCGDVVGEAE